MWEFVIPTTHNSRKLKLFTLNIHHVEILLETFAKIGQIICVPCCIICRYFFFFSLLKGKKNIMQCVRDMQKISNTLQPMGGIFIYLFILSVIFLDCTYEMNVYFSYA